MITFETDLYVDKVNARGEYDQKIDCRADGDESSVKYPQKITITIRKKNFDKFDSSLGVNDFIHVKLYPSTRNGIGKSTGRPFSITDLIVTNLVIKQRGNAPTEEVPTQSEFQDQVPF